MLIVMKSVIKCQVLPTAHDMKNSAVE